MLLQEVVVNPADLVDHECFRAGGSIASPIMDRASAASTSSGQSGEASFDFPELLDRLEAFFSR